MDVADGLQDIWDEYMTQTRPPRDQWNTVRDLQLHFDKIHIHWLHDGTNRHTNYTMDQLYQTHTLLCC